MKIIVTGASGFLGTALCKHLVSIGHEVTALNSKICDLTESNSLLRFNNVQYDQIFHLACWTQAGYFCLSHPGEQWIINQKINTYVLEWWHKHQPQAKLVAIGTSCSYAPDMDLVEDNYLLGKPIESLFAYGMTKRMLYVGLLALQKQFDKKYLCLVPSTLYGPSYHTDGRQMHFIFDLIRKILRGKLYGESVVLWGNGHQKRELVHVSDFVQIMLKLNASHDNELINIGAGEEFSIREFAQIICEKVDYDPALIQYDTSRYVGATSKCLSVKKLKSFLPKISLIPLRDGIFQTVEWFRKNQEKLIAKN